MKKRILTISLACLFLIAGFLMTWQVFSRFLTSVLAQHEEMLTDTADSVDRSLQGYLRIHRETLEYITARPGFTEAEARWLQTGEPDALLLRMQENLLTQDLYIKTLLAVRDGSVLLSADGNTGYLLPEVLSQQFLCRDKNGTLYFALLQQRGDVAYAAVIEPDVLCRHLAENAALRDTDRILLMDQNAQAVIQHSAGLTSISLLTDDLLVRSPAIRLMASFVGTPRQEVGFFEAEKTGDPSATGYVMTGDRGSSNGCFTLCLLTSYDSYLDTIKRDALLLAGSCAVTLSGLVLLIFYAGILTAENRKASRELTRLKDRQKTLEEINRQTRQLAHHQRLETIGTLTSSISHEFNNLLTPIMSYSLMTLEKLPPEEEELADNLIEIFNASEKAKEIISRLADLSRKNSPNTFRRVSLDALVRRTLDIAMPAKPQGVEIKLNLNCWDQPIRANEVQITQLLLNLILNAFHAMGDTGILVISTTFDDQCLKLSVSDNGPGIPKDIQEKIFEPFFTTKDPGKGTGLGLAIAAQVVEDHAGTIQVFSNPGEGATFSVRIPRQEERE